MERKIKMDMLHTPNFVLPKEVEKDSDAAIKRYLRAHKNDISLLEPVGGYRYGILFVGGGIEDWDEL